LGRYSTKRTLHRGARGVNIIAKRRRGRLPLFTELPRRRRVFSETGLPVLQIPGNPPSPGPIGPGPTGPYPLHRTGYERYSQSFRELILGNRASGGGRSRKLRNCRRRWSSSGANALAAGNNVLHHVCATGIGYLPQENRRRLTNAPKPRPPPIGA
jgi:hypothetical protein